MDLFDLALGLRDFEWMKELKEQMEALETTSTPDVADSSDANRWTGLNAAVFNEEAVALENIITQYAVKEKNGIRSFNLNSEFDRDEAELVILEKPPYAKGDRAKYHVPTKDELLFMRGTVNGFVAGYQEAYHNLNTQFMQYYNAMANRAKQAADGKSENQTKGRKKKINPPS